MPEPDVAILRGSYRDYLDQHPTGTDVLLVVELSQSTQTRDRAKAAIYARAGVPEYWIIDLGGQTIQLHRRPDADGAYQETRRVPMQEPIQVGDAVVRVSDLLT